MQEILNLNSVEEARERIKSYVMETPIFKSETLSEILGANVFFKCEFMQQVGSFKIRGAANKMLSAIERGEKFNWAITASSGNHGIAVAYMAKKLNKRALVVIPSVASTYKVSLVAAYGAEIIRKGKYSEQAARLAKKLAELKKELFIHAYDDKEVIEGQATIGLEIANYPEEFDYLIVPVGGGGLIAGVSYVMKKLRKNTKIIAVQPKTNPSLYQALKKGKIVTSTRVKTIAEGLAPRRIGELVFEIVKDKIDEVALESDDNIIMATRLLFVKERILLEPSGAAALAYLLDHKPEKDSKILVLLTGRNASKSHIENILSYSGLSI